MVVTESNSRLSLTSQFNDGVHDVINSEKCCHLVSEYAASARPICSTAA